MRVFGLTGGVGMGKTTSATFFAARGVCVADTDAIARELVRPGEPALTEILAAFGPGLAGDDGWLKREDLARLVFADAPARRRLEAMLHPRIRQVWQARLAEWRQEGRELAVVVIPLLFETEAEACFDRVICVACLPPTQRERLRARGWPDEQIDQRIAAQLPVAEKLRRAHAVIWTEGPRAAHEAQVERLLAPG